VSVKHTKTFSCWKVVLNSNMSLREPTKLLSVLNISSSTSSSSLTLLSDGDLLRPWTCDREHSSSTPSYSLTMTVLRPWTVSFAFLPPFLLLLWGPLMSNTRFLMYVSHILAFSYNYDADLCNPRMIFLLTCWFKWMLSSRMQFRSFFAFSFCC